MMDRFSFFKLPLKDLFIAERKYFGDNRGSFGRIYCKEEFQKIGVKKSIVQINHSITQKKGNIRGLHYQIPPFSEIKIISCLKGKIFDVAVDLRRGSTTFLRYHSEILSEENKRTIVIPEGFAHGFQTLTDNCEMIYLHTEYYSQEAERGINVNDKTINIRWPISLTGISERDSSLPSIDNQYEGLVL